MNFVLLLGAGFSRNWGGLLAAEVIGDLVGRSQVDDEMRALLHRTRDRGGFEEALSQLQSEYRTRRDETSRRRLTMLQSAIMDMLVVSQMWWE